MKQKIICITGGTGQDGSYLIEKMLAEGNKVVVIVRRSSMEDKKYYNIQHLLDNPNLIIENGDLTDAASIWRLISQHKPDEFYNLGAQSHVGASFTSPESTFEINANGVVNCLEAIRVQSPTTKFYQASSVTFDTPVVIKVDGNVHRTNFQNAYDLFHEQKFTTFEVLTADNDGKTCFRNVTDAIDHGYKEIYEIEIRNKIKLKITGDHSLIQIKDEKFAETKVHDIDIEKDRLLTFCNNTSIFDNNTYQTINHSVEYDKHIPSRWVGSNGYKHIKDVRDIKIDEQTAYILGMYVAEGSSYTGEKNYKLTFTFGKCDFDKNRPTEVKEYFKKYFNKNVTINDRATSIQVSVNDIFITSLFDKICNKGAHNKVIPNVIFNSPTSVVKEFLNGYLGDAAINKKTVTYTTVSQELATDVIYLLRMLGVPSVINTRFNKAHLSPQKTIIKDSMCYDIKIPYDYFWNNHDKRSCKKFIKPSCLVIPKNSFNISREKNPSREKLITENNKWGFSDIGSEKIKSINKNSILERVGDFSVEGTEKWYCGITPILVHNTSEMYGDNMSVPQNENTTFSPNSPYACAKMAAHNLVVNYRKAYGLFTCSGVLFNHESERRGEQFVTRKITKAAARIKLGLQNELRLGNLEAQRDWGYAPEYVDGMILMMRHSTPDDYVLATGVTHTIRDFIHFVGEAAGFDLMKYVVVDDSFKRPSEVPLLLGDSSKARSVLGWKPKTDVKQLAKLMYDADLEKEKMNVK